MERTSAPTATEPDRASLLCALDLLVDELGGTAGVDALDLPAVVVHGPHDELVAATVWGRWDEVKDDLFATLDKHQGLAVSGWEGSRRADDLLEVTVTGEQYVLERHWLRGETDRHGQDVYQQARAGGFDSDLACDIVDLALDRELGSSRQLRQPHSPVSG
jgi:hypothetical protein